jgi:adenosylcobinamide-GDP ribazoletransferase
MTFSDVITRIKRRLPNRTALAAGWLHYRLALSLLTRIPVPAPWPADLKWGVLTGWFPAVGLTIGLLMMAAGWGWAHIADPFPLIGGGLVLALWVVLTGGLHLDGWSDCADAFLVPVSRERRLEIMSDPHVGAFGVMWTVLLLLLKYSGVVYIMSIMIGELGFWWQIRALWPLVTASVAARAVMVALLAHPYFALARPGGMGAMARDGLGWNQAVQAGVTALVVALLGGWPGLVMLLAATVTGVGVAFAARNRIGGLTGDVLGAAVEAAETMALVAASIHL